MSKEAMKLALEALEPLVRRAAPWGELDWLNGCKAISALREALAEPDFWEGYVPEPDSTCSNALRIQHKPYPRTCKKCGLGPCVELAQQALDKKTENARELGLDYEPSAGTQVSKVWWDGEKLMAKPIPLEDFYEPAQQEPVAAECNFVGTKEWGRCSIEHHNLVQSEPHKWPGYQTRLLYTSHQPARKQEPVRIYDYVWPQREEHKDECIYACSYTPSQHLERGELLAVVHPSQLKNAYLQRDGEAAHGIGEKNG